eukprot:COSAG01_NODE_561_length_15460_cov_95.444307_9_plen_183_part_00
MVVCPGGGCGRTHDVVAAVRAMARGAAPVLCHHHLHHYCDIIEAPWLVHGGHGASLRLLGTITWRTPRVTGVTQWYLWLRSPHPAVGVLVHIRDTHTRRTGESQPKPPCKQSAAEQTPPRPPDEEQCIATLEVWHVHRALRAGPASARPKQRTPPPFVLGGDTHIRLQRAKLPALELGAVRQ